MAGEEDEHPRLSSRVFSPVRASRRRSDESEVPKKGGRATAGVETTPTASIGKTALLAGARHRRVRVAAAEVDDAAAGGEDWMPVNTEPRCPGVKRQRSAPVRASRSVEEASQLPTYTTPSATAAEEWTSRSSGSARRACPLPRSTA
jgi:hypothetical protein